MSEDKRSVTDFVRETGENAGGRLASIEYEVNFPRHLDIVPHPRFPSLHVTPNSQGAAEFIGVLESYADDPEEFVLLEVSGRNRVFSFGEGLLLREDWRDESEKTVVTWTILLPESEANEGSDQ